MTSTRPKLGLVCLSASVLCSLTTWWSAATVSKNPNPALVAMAICAGLYLVFGMLAVAMLGYKRGTRPYFALAISRLIFAGGVLMTIMEIAFKA